MAETHDDLRRSLDPLSQLIGAQTAQIAGVSSSVSELRADILQNRLNADVRHTELSKIVEDLRIESRTIKHESRNQDMAREGIITQIRDLANKVQAHDDHDDTRFAALCERLDALETTIEAWRNKLAAIVGLILLVGGVLPTALQLILNWSKLLGP